MALVKDDWVIRKTSTTTIATANNTIRNQLDIKQNDSKNRDINNNYIDNYFADLFDARDGSLYRIWSTAATNSSSVIAGNAANGDSYYTVVNVGNIKTSIETTLNMSSYALKTELPDLEPYALDVDVIQVVDNKINQIQIDEVIIG